ncbi:MAG TPA: purine-binding chemotaxis protein CheW [Clostridiaceae bacterium]|nr:purine-binding chemotaxis protein CheW [Clostridiaceae bacterium]
MNEMQAIIFRLNDQICGADTSQVKEIKKYTKVSKIPDVPEFIEGAINLRGQVVPIVNLNSRFGLGKSEVTSKTKILITAIKEQLVGFTVNDVLEIAKFTDEDIEDVPDVLRNKTNYYLKSIGKKGDELVTIIDLSKILNNKEIDTLSHKVSYMDFQI